LHGLLQPHVLRFHVIHRGDYVPRGATLGHQVEGLEEARDMKGVIICGRVGGTHTEPYRAHCDRHETGNWVHLHAADAMRDRFGKASAMELRHAEPVIEESQLELTGLEHSADMGVVVGRGIIDARKRMPPRAREIRTVLRLQEPHQDHFAHATSPSWEVLHRLASKSHSAETLAPRPAACVRGLKAPAVRSTWSPAP